MLKSEGGRNEPTRLSFLLTFALAISSASSAAADDREEYARCVTEELAHGTSLSAIGDRCLRRARSTPAAEEPSWSEAEKPEEEAYPYEQSLREALAVEGSLLDPESARFKDLVYADRYAGTWCGQVNAKNRYGGYVGWKYFALRDRHRGGRKRAESIDFTIGGLEIESTCKNYQAWVRENW